MGQVRLWLGMVVLATRHLASACKGAAHGVGRGEDMGRVGTARAPSSHQTYTSPSGRAGALTGAGSGAGSSTRAASPHLMFAGGVNIPETLNSTSGWRERRRPHEEVLVVRSFPW